MGWDGIMTNGRTKEEVIREELYRYKIIASNWSGSTFYAAVENKLGRIFAMVILTRKDARYTYLKVMDETEGPHYYEASKKVMQALTPINVLYPDGGGYAENWRIQCSEAKEKKPVINVGDTIEFIEPLTFLGGKSAKFKREYKNVYSAEGGQLVTIKKPEQYGKYIVTAPTQTEQLTIF